MDLPQGNHIMAEYIWIDADGGLRSKTTVSGCADGGGRD